MLSGGYLATSKRGLHSHPFSMHSKVAGDRSPVEAKFWVDIASLFVEETPHH